MTKTQIDSFLNKSRSIYEKYPKIEAFVKSELNNLQKRWQDLLQMSRNQRVVIDSSVSYFKMLDEVRAEIANWPHFCQLYFRHRLN